jgi:hypothetical protein
MFRLFLACVLFFATASLYAIENFPFAIAGVMTANEYVHGEPTADVDILVGGKTESAVRR